MSILAQAVMPASKPPSAAPALKPLPSVFQYRRNGNGYQNGNGYHPNRDTPYRPLNQKPTSPVKKQGYDVLHDPVLNKGRAFPICERERLHLRGLLPPTVATLEDQETLILNDFHNGWKLISPEHVEEGGITGDMVRKWKVMQSLQDRNETLFYKLLVDNITEMAPIIYTPTVGWVCTNYHRVTRRPRGMYFSRYDRGEMAAMVYNWPSDEVDAIVVTDGSRILGLGDLGINGIGIPIGKLDLYVAAGGFSPSRVLPCVLDVGTNNQRLIDDPLYRGVKEPRLEGPEYYAMVDEFVQAVMARYPNAVLQFEDFKVDHALPLLDRYRWEHLVFNDDVQGTACVAVAGLYGALRNQGKSASAIKNLKIVCMGAGSAGMGVVSLIAQGMVRHGLTQQEAAANFWVFDSKGLITSQRAGVKDHQAPFVRQDTLCRDMASLAEVIETVKPDVLIGLSGMGGLFTESVVRTMAAHCSQPIIMPMSNPTSKLECTAADAQRWTDGRAIFASGSPQPNITHNGMTIASSQANNMYIFPGLAQGAFLGQTGNITDEMLMAAAEALPKMLTDEDIAMRKVYPDLHKIREISAQVAVDTCKQAAAEGRLQGKALAKLADSEDALLQWIKDCMFQPQYTSLVEVHN